MLTTHINMEEGPADPFGEPTSQKNIKGTELWNQWASSQQNLELIVNGHALDEDDTDPDDWAMTARQTSTGVYGNRVTEIGFNTQDAFPGGGGWLRLYTFLDDGRTLHVRTYAPFIDSWLTDDRNDFTFLLTPISADFNGDNTINGPDLQVWEESFGVDDAGDADGDGNTDGQDFLAWQNQFGNIVTTASGITSVPETSSLLLNLTICMFLGLRRTRKCYQYLGRS